MSELWFNLRIGLYHLYIGPWIFRICRNNWHRNRGSPFIQLYQAPWTKP